MGNKILTKLLSNDFENRGRYKSITNVVAVTWLILFVHILRESQLAGEYLKLMCFLAEKDIPLSLPPSADDGLEAVKAVSTLKAYVFIIEREDYSLFNVHWLI